MNPAKMEIEVDLLLAGERLDRFLVGKLPSLSRAAIQRFIKDGRVQVNSAPAKSNHLVREGEMISIAIPEPRATEVQPEAIPLDVLFEDGDLLVVNKLAGMTVHPGAGNAEHTLVNALLHHCAGSLSGIGGELRPGIVHRLDKDTSGCMVVAKNDAAHQALSAQFQRREVKKVYLALVAGVATRDSGVIQASIGRHRVHRKQMTVDETRGRKAVTEYRVKERFASHTLLEAAIHTGRTHQIRVHLAHLGHPVLGDATYGRKTQMLSRDSKTAIIPPRQMLHAWRLGFAHPSTGKAMQFEAALPDDMQDALEKLRTLDVEQKNAKAAKK